MAYSTAVMVRQALVPSSDGTQTTGTGTAADLSDAQLADAISEADATIDAYIGGYYAVPVAQVSNATPHPIDFWSRNLAAYFATLAWRGSMDFTETDPVARRYKETMDALTAVMNGKLRLQLPENTSGNSAIEPGSALNPYVGDLWDPTDFSLFPAQSPQLNNASPFWGTWWT